jgi:hypothetical protein
MTREASRAAFRAQLVISEQRQLYDYWLAKAAGEPMPSRADINPTDFPRLLPDISLIAIERETKRLRFRFRLAGTRLRDLYDREVTGLYLDEMDWGGQAGYWRAAHERVATTGRPAQGIVRELRTVKNHLVQFWLRLPLRTDGPEPGMIMCCDICLPVAEVKSSLIDQAPPPHAIAG